MGNKLLVGLGILLLIFTIGYLGLNYYNRYMSPSAETQTQAGELTVKVEYASPSVRDRVIFGANEEEALLPYRQYWRLGANEPTRLTVNKDFTFGDQNIEAGSYDMYAFPAEGSIELRLNKELRPWGMSEPNYENEVAQITVPMEKTDSHIEEFTINAVQKGENKVQLEFLWADWRWTADVQAQ